MEALSKIKGIEESMEGGFGEGLEAPRLEAPRLEAPRGKSIALGTLKVTPIEVRVRVRVRA